MDTFSAFLADLSPALVEMERLGDYPAARRESFGHASHREMLAHHEIERARFKLRMAANENHLAGAPRRAEEKADADRVSAYKKHQEEKRSA